ncbi:MAG: SdpI family protein [Candidatus Burarchaeum sp.]|nr:SdpI family protein [Candidatus Burarchaeum sp.]MDO8339404.1 SdpI family protein [Candidatus Burarchaeum sp.]
MMLSKSEVAVLGIVVLSFLLGLYAYPQMSDKVASHWNAAGEVDGYMPKFWGTFFVPILIAVLGACFMLLPKIDPLRGNYAKFRPQYNGFVLLLMLFMLAIYVQTLLWNTGTKIGMVATMPIGIGLLFFYVGMMCEKAERNWFVGIRTPWSMSSDAVWKKTNVLGGKLFKLCGVLAIVGILFKGYEIWFVLVPVLLAAAYTFIYSYLEYQKEQGKNKEKGKKTGRR